MQTALGAAEARKPLKQEAAAFARIKLGDG